MSGGVMNKQCEMRVNKYAIGSTRITGDRQCLRASTTFKNGEWLCSQHSKLKQKNQFDHIAVEQKRQRKWAEIGPELLKALIDLYELISRWPRAITDEEYGRVTNAAAVIEKAKGIGE